MLQDGTVESDIPSPELFPIHYLDELEFFPGDYVVDAKGKQSETNYCLPFHSFNVQGFWNFWMITLLHRFQKLPVKIVTMELWSAVITKREHVLSNGWRLWIYPKEKGKYPLIAVNPWTRMHENRLDILFSNFFLH